MATITPRISFVFRPGEKNPDNNVFAKFEDLVTAMEGVPGLKIIEFDDSLLETITPDPPSHIKLPGKTFPMHLVSWTASAPRSDVNRISVKVEVPDGCSLPGLRMISGQIEVECSADTPPVSDFSKGGHVIQFGSRLDNGIPFLYCTGKASFFDLGSLPQETPCTIAICQGHWAEARDLTTVITQPPVSVTEGTVIFRLLPFGFLGKNMIRAEAKTRVILEWYGGVEAEEQSSIAGTFEIRNVDRPRNRLMPQSLATSAAPLPAKEPVLQTQTGDVVLINPEGKLFPFDFIEQQLPPIRGSFALRPKSTLGHQLIIKNVARFIPLLSLLFPQMVVVRPADGNRIDGTRASVLLRNGESCIFESDGMRNWYVVAFSRRPRRSANVILQHPDFDGVIS